MIAVLGVNLVVFAVAWLVVERRGFKLASGRGPVGSTIEIPRTARFWKGSSRCSNGQVPRDFQSPRRGGLGWRSIRRALRPWRGYLLGAPVLGLGTLLATGCGVRAAGQPFKPVHPGVLTVATAVVPAPGFWEGKASSPTGGFEYELAVDIAKRLDLHGVRVVLVPFARIASGHLGAADVALTQMTPTTARERTENFTTPYLTATPGILARRGVTASDLEGLQERRWVALATSTLTPILMNTVRPRTPPSVVADRKSELAALDSGRADAVLLDLPVAEGLARAKPRLYHVIGQLSGGEGLAVVLPHGSGNTDIVDSAVRALLADNKMADLAHRWLGGTGGNIPLIRTDG